MYDSCPCDAPNSGVRSSRAGSRVANRSRGNLPLPTRYKGTAILPSTDGRAGSDAEPSAETPSAEWLGAADGFE